MSRDTLYQQFRSHLAYLKLNAAAEGTTGIPYRFSSGVRPTRRSARRSPHPAARPPIYVGALALQAGIDVKIVSERLGASATITWDIYQHVTPTMQSDAADRVGNLIFRPRASS